MYCLDANIWVYYFDARLPEHQAVVGAVESVLTDQPLFTTTVLQMEVVHYLDTQIAESSEQIDWFLGIDDVTVAELTTDDVAAGAELLDTYPSAGLGGRDATVVAAMDRYGVTTLWTHDGGLQRLGERVNWLTVVDPVEEATPLEE